MPYFNIVTALSVRNDRQRGALERMIAASAEGVRARKAEFDAALDEVERLEAAIENNAALDGRQGGAAVPLEDIVSDVEYELSGKQKELAESEVQERGFSVEHNLDRKPVLPDAVFSALLLGLAVFVEAAVNASFFYNAHLVAGPSAALLLSFLISLTNISLSVFAGWFIGPRLHYGLDAPEPGAPEFVSKRVLAKRLLAGFVVSIIFFHITVGLVRSLETLDALEHSISTYASVLATPEAVFLIMIGACMSAFAYYKGHHGFDDPYLGYGRYGRAKRRIREEIDAIYAHAVNAIEDRFDERLDEIEEALATHEKKLSAYNAAIKAARAAFHRLKSEVERAHARIASQIKRIDGEGGDEGHASHTGMAFEHVLKRCQVPPYRPRPNLSEQKERLAADKAEALQRLARLFQDRLCP